MRRVVIALLIAVALVGGWRAWRRHRANAPPVVADVACPSPPPVADLGAPRQSDLPRGIRPFRLHAATLRPLAGMSIDARVLSREDYGSGRESTFSPTDLALGWGRMRDDAVLERLDIRQSGRWYFYRWSGDAPIPVEEIVRSSANMHMVPADASVARLLDDVDAGDRVRIDGWLVEAQASDGWRWRSSLSREDSGDGACEVVYVCSLRVLR